MWVTICTVDNPYDTMSVNQLSKINTEELCATVTNSRYKISANVSKELIKRGYRDCSESEIFCRENLSLKPQTQAYVACRIQRDQYYLNVQSQEMAAYLGMRQLQLQQQAIYRANQPINVNVHHAYY